jgi:DNA ligase 1
MEDGSVEIYSRNAERNTGKYPDVVDTVSRYTSFLISTYLFSNVVSN